MKSKKIYNILRAVGVFALLLGVCVSAALFFHTYYYDLIYVSGASMYPTLNGDEVKVSVRIVEGNKTRIQNFQGVVISRRGGGVSATFTVRKMSGGIGVERTFPVNSPSVASVQVVRKGKVRRNKITYIRKLSGKSARIKEIL